MIVLQLTNFEIIFLHNESKFTLLGSTFIGFESTFNRCNYNVTNKIKIIVYYIIYCNGYTHFFFNKRSRTYRVRSLKLLFLKIFVFFFRKTVNYCNAN